VTILLGVEAPPPLEVPESVPDLPGRDRSGLVHDWTGWDGSFWELSRRRSGVRLKQGVKGLDDPPHERFADTGIGAGARTRGTRTLERQPFWPLGIYCGGDSQAWYDYAAAFLRSVDPDREGIWGVTQPNGTRRTLNCRLLDPGDAGHATDPGQLGWGRYDLTLVADQPFWQGEEIVLSFEADPGRPFLGGPGVIGISSGNTLARAKVTNPGDVPAWPVYRISGEPTKVSVGLGGRQVEVPFALTDGLGLTINTGPGPRGKSAYDTNGVRRTADLSRREFAPVPPGESVPLSLSMEGNGRVEVSLVPLYRRAFGA